MDRKDLVGFPLITIFLLPCNMCDNFKSQSQTGVIGLLFTNDHDSKKNFGF